MQLVRSGQAHLYRGHGDTGIIMEAHMKQPVNGLALSDALKTTLQRYPYMASRLVELQGNLYLDEAIASMRVSQTGELPILGSEATDYHLIHVTYLDTTIRVAFHHTFCDGRGAKPFVETLLYYYGSLYAQTALDASGVRLAGEPLLPGERHDPMNDSLYPVVQQNVTKPIYSAYSLPEKGRWGSSSYRYGVTIDLAQFLAYAKQYQATPTILTALWISASIVQTHSDATQPVVCSLATDLRQELGLADTFKKLPGNDQLSLYARNAGVAPSGTSHSVSGPTERATKPRCGSIRHQCADRFLSTFGRVGCR